MGLPGGTDEVERTRRASGDWLSRHAIRLAREMHDELGQPAEVTDLALVHEVMAVLASRLDHPSAHRGDDVRARGVRGSRAQGGSTTAR